MRLYKEIKCFIGIATLCLSMIASAKVCEIPLDEIEVANVRIGDTVEDFGRNHHIKLDSSLHHIDLIDTNGYATSSSDELLEENGVTSVQHISYNPKSKTIASFGLSFTDGKYANFNTPLNVFKKNMLNKFSLPQNGWVKSSKTTYTYKCNDYNVDISQDFGEGKTTTGASVVVMTKLMSDWNYWKNR